MAAPLYARYIPPNPSATSAEQSTTAVVDSQPAKKSKKRGRDGDDQSQRRTEKVAKTKHIAQEAGAPPHDPGLKSEPAADASPLNGKTNGTKATADPTTRDRDPQAKNKSSVLTKEKKKKKFKDSKLEIESSDPANGDRDGHQVAESVDASEHNGQDGERLNATEKKTKSRKIPKARGENINGVEAKDRTQPTLPEAQKHSGIFSKFEKSMSRSQKISAASGEIGEDPVEEKELRDLVPIPIPKSQVKLQSAPSYSVQPDWLAHPVVASNLDCPPFSALAVHAKLLPKLQAQGMTTTLPIQAAVLPFLLSGPQQYPGDICVSASTGSGKTLAYVLPIVQSLLGKTLTKLRALIIVPTRELVAQVREVIVALTSGTDIVTATATGARTFASESGTLVERYQSYDLGLEHHHARIDQDEDQLFSVKYLSDEELLPDHRWAYESKVDILICTPGRLVEHIKSTQGFNLEDLQWLVVDEADKLLDQSFQEWLDVIYSALGAQRASSRGLSGDLISPHDSQIPRSSRQSLRKVILSATMTEDLDALQPLNLRIPKLVLSRLNDVNEMNADSKSSAPSKLALPTTLEEHGVPVGDGAEKPLHLLKLLSRLLGIKEIIAHTNPSETSSEAESSSDSDSEDSDDSISTTSTSSSAASSASPASSASSSSSSSSSSPNPTPAGRSNTRANALIFTSSNESASRLASLLTLLSPPLSTSLGTLTKSTSRSQTATTLSAFAGGSLRILIATDRASRGLDIPSLTNVINYDIPHSLTTYVHRVGRTARAGKSGAAWTLLEDRQARWFWNDIAKGSVERGGAKVRRIRIADDEIQPLRAAYETALGRLKEDVRAA